jgi:hypothetical protein
MNNRFPNYESSSAQQVHSNIALVWSFVIQMFINLKLKVGRLTESPNLLPQARCWTLAYSPNLIEEDAVHQYCRSIIFFAFNYYRKCGHDARGHQCGPEVRAHHGRSALITAGPRSSRQVCAHHGRSALITAGLRSSRHLFRNAINAQPPRTPKANANKPRCFAIKTSGLNVRARAQKSP